jgi:hypothetical protein
MAHSISFTMLMAMNVSLDERIFDSTLVDGVCADDQRNDGFSIQIKC